MEKDVLVERVDAYKTRSGNTRADDIRDGGAD